MRYVIARSAPPGLKSHERLFLEGKTLFTGDKEFRKNFAEPTSLELDLLRIGAAVFAVDRATKRGDNERLDRDFEVQIPVVNAARLSAVRHNFERVLHTLSNDWWSLEFLPITGNEEGNLERDVRAGETLLFSGGLDSLAAAIQFGKAAKPLQLVSHRTKNQPTTRAQDELVRLLEKSGYNLVHRSYFVSSASAAPPTFDHDIENSQRTRSFVFLIIGALSARRSGHRKLVYLAENGQMAVHLPLTPGRLGALSTHTAHPDVLVHMETILRSVLSYDLEIRNPYLYKTKKEVVSVVWKDLRKAIPISTSCWKNSRLKPPATHCGECVPCYIRRIAIEHHGKDETVYAKDPWASLSSLSEDDDGRRNLCDLAEFVYRVKTKSNADLLDEYPELLGTVADMDVDKVLDMYRRFSKETEKVWSAYPSPKSLLL